jgi:hypothetical protein
MAQHSAPTDGNELWSLVLKQLENKINPKSFQTWFEPTQAELIGDRLIILCPNEFTQSWIQNQYGRLILDTIKMLNSTPMQVDFLVGETNGENKVSKESENLEEKMIFIINQCVEKIKINDFQKIDIIKILVSECLQTLGIELTMMDKNDLISGFLMLKSEIMNRSHSKDELIYERLLNVYVMVDYSLAKAT